MGDDSSRQHLISLDDFKKSLGPVAQNMTEKQIEELRQKQDRMAEAIFDGWLKNQSNQRGVIEQGIQK